MQNPDPQRKPNRLINQKSPYLQQHAYNPVDWYPWGEEAFKKAEEEDKPVFVSIGYSTCHWCHVMEKESFENERVAAAMNRYFVCIKVDREERPDLDAAYMAVCQSMGRSCGWPLNVVMTPKKNPFYVASYIPADSRFGNVGMLDLAPQLAQIYRSRRSEMEQIGVELKEQIMPRRPAPKESELGKDELDEAFDQLFLVFDHENAGFGNAPKFPSPHNLLFLMRYYKRTGQKEAWSMVERTLRAMRRGGIFDQVGLGFHRYSTDARWLVPHFEKMLYDQAMLALAYLEGYQLSGQLKFKVTAKETLDYVLRDLAASEGGFYSAEDADSEGEEGKFYLWTADELKQALPEDHVDFAFKLFGVRLQGNYMEPNMTKSGRNILHLELTPDQVASEFNMTVDQVIAKLAKTVSLLYQARQKRVHPGKDTKILVDWNGLTIAALARASRVLGEKRYLEAAEQAADFILDNMLTAEMQLFHRYAEKERAVGGFLDDYAFLIWGLVQLYQADFDEKYLQTAMSLARVMIAQFGDKENGGFYFSGSAAETAVPQIKQNSDGAYPSGNSVALWDLLLLARLSGEVTFERTAQKLLDASAGDIKGYPMGRTFMLAGLDYAMGPSYSVVLAGEKQASDTEQFLEAIAKKYVPNLTVKLWTAKDAKTASPRISYERIGGKATAYVCQNQTCMPPTADVAKMLEYLEAAKSSG
ncbi:MAG: thioredoxin domain-containing protein [Candidatus Bathyarchaeota archaeon]|nr:thioredoxin domain-containing protein [Candidatus Bathyarchaeota archaeon]